MKVIASQRIDRANWSKSVKSRKFKLVAAVLFWLLGWPLLGMAYSMNDPAATTAASAASVTVTQTSSSKQSVRSTENSIVDGRDESISENKMMLSSVPVINAIERLVAIVAASITALTFAVIASRRFSAVFSADDPTFSFRRHWGGFGGSVTGWRISPAFVQLLVAATLMGVSLLLALAILNAVFDGTTSEERDRPSSGAPASEAAHSSSAHG